MYSSSSIIETRDLYKSFGKITVVNNLNLAVCEGKIHGFVGPEGAGKTTVMKMLIGAIRPSGGYGTIKGYDMGSMDARKITGYAPESVALYNDMSLIDYLVYMALLGRVGYRTARSRANELLDFFGLFEHRDIRAGKLSTVMNKKIGLAQAIIHRPEILILDGVTAGLDRGERLDIIENIKKLAGEENLTILISSRTLPELEPAADYISIIDRGEIVLKGDMESIKGEFEKSRFILKTSDSERMIEALSKTDCAIEISGLEKGLIKVTSHDPRKLKKEIIAIIHSEDLDLEYFSEESISQVYKSIISGEDRY